MNAKLIKLLLLIPVVAVLSLFLLPGCAPDTREKMIIGTNKWIGYEPLYVARDHGFIDDNTFKLIEFSSASQVAKSFEQGLIDVAALTLDELLRLAKRSDDYSVLLITDYSYGGDTILAQSNYQSLQQLMGKPIGLEDNAVSEYLFYRALQLNNLNYNDFQMVPLQVNQHTEAFIGREVEAVATFEPVKTQLLNKGAVELFNSRQIPEEIIDILVIRKSNESKFRDHIPKLLNAWYKAISLIEKRNDKAINLMARRLDVSPTEIDKMLTDIQIPNAQQVFEMIYAKTPQLKLKMINLIGFLQSQGLNNDDINIKKLFPRYSYVTKNAVYE